MRVRNIFLGLMAATLPFLAARPGKSQSPVGGSEASPPSSESVRATDCTAGIGPDVIVGELTGPFSWSAVGGIEAFSVGTTSCNIGDTELLWINDSSPNGDQHPVIGQNLFRLKDDRFEQIGQSWLKHGFFALQQNACGCGCISAGTDGRALGVGCSDPYFAELNGSQEGLGPKWQVNPHTGEFPFPFQDKNVVGDGIYKRLQVRISDLDPAQDGGGFYYFLEGQYITPDDAAAGNGDNNASYRQVTVSGSGSDWNLTFVAPTVREQPAIRAWKVLDPEVLEKDISVPGDGLFITAMKTVDLGNGTWRYEYAIHNLNSDRAARAFTVPFTQGADVTNVGFHDVDYHSGDGENGVNFNGDAWSVTIEENAVRWAAAPHSANPNANALRWGTLYNFRFDCNAAPAPATVTLDLFKPGTPETATASVEGPTGAISIGPCTGPDGDFDGMNGTNGEDLPIFVDALINGATPDQECRGDFDGLNGLDIGDIPGMVSALLAP